MPTDLETGRSLIAAWRTNNRVTMYLIENLPPAMWSRAVPGVPRRTVRMIAAHIHNVRCMWIKMMGARHGIAIPRTVDPRRVRASELLRALSRSSDGIIRLLQLGIAQGFGASTRMKQRPHKRGSAASQFFGCRSSCWSRPWRRSER